MMMVMVMVMVMVMMMMTMEGVLGRRNSATSERIHDVDDMPVIREQQRMTRRMSDYESIMAAGDWEAEPVYAINLTSVYLSNEHVAGHITTLFNPKRTLSFYENPTYGCGVGLEYTSTSARILGESCLVGHNAGFFGSDGTCIGHVISNGEIIQQVDTGRSHFGVTSDGYLISGYITNDDIRQLNFSNLITGLGWLVRNGESYVQESSEIEGIDESWCVMKSARLAIGHTANGDVVLLHYDGRSNIRGINLYDLADTLIRIGVVNAINLDGGGSTTFVNQGILASYPSDPCGTISSCERKVSTIVCIGQRQE
jgi:N-acetylglucosamine-1-phosphodiester alpha-N-acetylglucosaminidase